ncbi:gliding motility-associated lipoprotein GldH [Dysgonomonas hofstadii]|uniref:Gliding motility-associated lipoprotein GldH n=1 Tax=Dysgonomonas hofstadii TaxID=637886 RepID=A0A840D021_9BACT|nr:gliding motility lipoprotein GldH [Dysgonomonas hofstadii]MBB4038275.1 gliding motility-associated lipoprotein GldH [Dysgonomonas hofstadii]
MENLIKTGLRRKSVLQYCVILLLAIGIISCQQQEIYSQFHELKNAEWAQNDTLVFDIDSAVFDLNTPYRFSIEVTNNVNYPYRNIWFFVSDNLKSDSIFDSTSKEYTLADDFGKWNGSGFATTFQLSLPLYDNFIFARKQNYRVKIQHGMRDEPLNGIEKLGLRIEKMEQ